MPDTTIPAEPTPAAGEEAGRPSIDLLDQLYDAVDDLGSTALAFAGLTNKAVEEHGNEMTELAIRRLSSRLEDLFENARDAVKVACDAWCPERPFVDYRSKAPN